MAIDYNNYDTEDLSHNEVESILGELEYFQYEEPLWDPVASDDDSWSQSTQSAEMVWLGYLRALGEDISDPKYGPSPREILIRGMEVGDDRVDLSQSRTALEDELKVQSSVTMMKTSIEDTSITKGIWNFTEVTGTLPCAKEESFDYARKSGNLDFMGYVDCPRLRIILDTRKGNSEFSNSSVGKASMLGTTINLSRSEYRENLHLSGFMQDAELRTTKSSDPKYLPKAMGGSGVAPLFNSAANLYSYVKSYKGGTYERVYGTSTNELRSTIQQLENGREAQPWFSQRLRDKQEYLHGTYAEKVFIPDTRHIVSNYWEVPPPIYKTSGVTVGISSVENRLTRAKRLISHSQARLLSTSRDRIVQVLEGTSSIPLLDLKAKIVNLAERERFEKALSANSAFQRLLSRCANDHDVNELLSDEFMKVVHYGSLHFKPEDAVWLAAGGKGRVLSIDDMRISEDMYVFSEFSLENSMRVAGIPLKVVANGKPFREQLTVKKIGLYEISSTQEEWCDNIMTSLLEETERTNRPLRPLTVRDIFSRDLEWVNDDTMIISSIIKDNANLPSNGFVVLVSDDKKLAKQAARSANLSVFLVPPLDVIMALEMVSISSKTRISFDDLRPFSTTFKELDMGYQPCVYIDTGSMMAAASKLQPRSFSSDDGYMPFVRKRLISVESTPYRQATYDMAKIVRSKGTQLGLKIFLPLLGKPGQTYIRRSTRLTRSLRTNVPSDSGLSQNSRARSWAESDAYEEESLRRTSTFS